MSDNTNRPGPWRHSRPAWLDEPVVPGLGPDALDGMDAEQIQHRAEAARQQQRNTRAELLARRVEDAAPAPKSSASSTPNPAPKPGKAVPAMSGTGSKPGKPAQRLSKPAPAAAQPRRGQSATPAPAKPADRHTAPQAPAELATPDDLAELLAHRSDPSRIYRF